MEDLISSICQHTREIIDTLERLLKDHRDIQNGKEGCESDGSRGMPDADASWMR